MNAIQKGFLFLFTVTAVLVMGAPQAFAQRGGGGHSLGVGLSLVTAAQTDINNAMERMGTSKSMSSAYEFFLQYGYRFSGSMFGLVFRGGYMTQNMSGNCTNGSCDAKLTGLAFYPMLRLVPLENNFIRFFMQAGLGFGTMSGSMSEGSNSVDFSGGTIGETAGIGADFCFTPTHCLTVEGNVRYMPIQRNVSSGNSGNLSGLTQTSGELEYDGNDMTTTMSGVQGAISYTMRF